MSKINLELVNGVEGDSIYLNDTRICGAKPWGGGKVMKKWTTSVRDIENALGFKFTDEQLGNLKKQEQ